MIVARSSGWAMDAAAARSSGRRRSGPTRGGRRRAAHRARAAPRCRSRLGSSSRTFRNRSRKPSSSTTATLAPQWPARYCDLFGCRRVVDRDGRGAEEGDGQVDPVELGDVAHHEHDTVAGPDAQFGQPGRGQRHVVGELPVGHRRPGVVPGHPTERGGVGSLARRAEELRGNGAPRGALVDLVGRGHDVPPGRRPRGSHSITRSTDGGAEPAGAYRLAPQRCTRLTPSTAGIQNLDRPV